MIVPNTWLTLQFTDRLRRYIVEKTAISEIVMFQHLVFQDANVFTALLLSRSESQMRSTKSLFTRCPTRIVSKTLLMALRTA